MPKVTTSPIPPNEPMYASVPIRTSARTSRLPNRFRNEWVKTSYMPSLSAPIQTIENQHVRDEDVTMVAPAEIAVKQEPGAVSTQVALNLRCSNEPIEAVERGIKQEVDDPEFQLAMQSLSLDSQAPAIGNGNNHVDGIVPNIEAEGRPLPVTQQDNEPRWFLDEAEERFRLEHAVETIDALNMRIHSLRKTEQRLRKQLREEKERLKNSKVESEGALSLLVIAEEKICEVEGLMVHLTQDVDRYRRWWLTEYYSLKAVLSMLPKGDKHDARHIAQAAHARFTSFSSNA